MKYKISNFNFKDLSKRYQFIIIITLLILLITTFFSLVLPNIVKNVIVDEFVSTQKATSLVIANSFSDLLKNNTDLSRAETTYNSLKKIDNLIHILVYDNYGNLVYEKTKDDTKSFLQLYRPRHDVSNYLDEQAELFIINSDIKADNQKVGNLTVSFSVAEINNRIKAIQYQIIFICILVLIVGFIVAVILSGLISKPLEILLNTIDEILLGNLSVHANISTKEEFGQIASAFNKIVDRLKESYTELAETTKNIENRVEQRTVQLKKQIEEHEKAESHLKIANKMITSIINTSPLPIITLTLDFKIKTANPAVKNIFFYEDFEIINKVVPIIYANEIDIFVNHVKKTSIPDQIEKFIIKGRKKNGQLLDLQVISASEYDTQEHVHIGYIVIVEDVTERLLAEQALKESEARYLSLISNYNYGVGILKNNFFTFANNTLLNIWGYQDYNEFLLTPLTDMVFVEDREKIIELYKNIDNATTEDILIPIMEIKIICYNGQEKFVEMAPNILNFNNEVYLQITFLDITDKRNTEQEMQQLNEDLEQKMIDRTTQLNKTLVELRNEIKQRNKLSIDLQFKSEILENTTSICIVFNAQAECIYVSPWTLTVLNLSSEKILGQNIWQNINFHTTDEWKLKENDIKKIIQGNIPIKQDYQTFQVVTAKNEDLYFQLAYLLGQKNTLIVFGTEITEQIRCQNELQVISDKLSKSLECEKELNEFKTGFLSIVSHELRVPLTQIMSSTAIIQQAIAQEKQNIVEQYLEKIVSTVKIMTELTDDILLIGQSNTSLDSNIVLINLVDFVKNSLENIQKIHTFDCNVVLEVSDEVIELYSNESAVNIIINNLINNALKYTLNNEDILIKINEINDEIVFLIVDKGIGIPQDETEHLFTNFHRAKNVGNISGTGLGLYIVKKNIEKIFGKITIESKENQGTTISVIFPKDIRQEIIVN